MLLEIRNFNPLLLPGIAIANRDCFVFQRLVVHRHTERRSDLVLSRVEFSDPAGIVINSAQSWLQLALDRLCHRDNLRFVFRQRQNRSFNWRQRGMELQYHPHLALVVCFF